MAKCEAKERRQNRERLQEERMKKDFNKRQQTLESCKVITSG